MDRQLIEKPSTPWIIRNLYWIVLVILVAVSSALWLYARDSKNKLEQELIDKNVKAQTDSLLLRKVIREQDDILMRYRDSIRTQRINYILLQNEKSRKQTANAVKSVATASDSTKTIMWVNEWAIKDTFPF